jgi:hypothetical protein
LNFLVAIWELLPIHHLSSPKVFPWCISDATPHDIFEMIHHFLLSSNFFHSYKALSDEKSERANSQPSLKALVDRWQQYFRTGVFSTPISATCQENENQVPDPESASKDPCAFWTYPSSFWYMEYQAPDLIRLLQGSALVIFKV